MKYIRKSFGLFLFLLVAGFGVLTLFSVRASAAEQIIAAGVCGENVRWTLDESGDLVISGSGEMYDYRVEDGQHGTIWGGAANRNLIKHVVVKTGVTSIGECVFLDCINMLYIQLPEGLNYIGQRAFNNCKKLRSITIPSTVIRIGSIAFDHTENLRRVVVLGTFSGGGSNGGHDSCIVYGNVGTSAKKFAESFGKEFKDLSTIKEKKKNLVTAFDITLSANTQKTQSAQIEAEVFDSARLTYRSNTPGVRVRADGVVIVPPGFSGTAKITVTAQSTCEYAEAAGSLTVRVRPSKTVLSGVSNKKGRKLEAKWEKNATGSGYQLQYAKDKKFKKGVVTRNLSGNGKISASYGKLTKGKTYYVRIRTVKKAGRSALYSEWSSTKRVKIKK